jgi:hypothetical protein
MDVMSLVCSGEFSSALKVIANQKETIEKIKEQFDFLAKLAKQKSSTIEPTFIKISTYNAEMGDWIIQQLLQREGGASNASLAGKLTICDKVMIPKRLKLILDMILRKIKEAKQVTPAHSQNQCNKIQSFLPFASIYTRTLRLAASSLTSSHDRIDMDVSKDTLLDIVSLLSDQGPSAECASVLREFVVLLIVPPVPFHNAKVDQFEFASQTLLGPPPQGSSDEMAVQMQQVAGILSGQSHELAMMIFSQKKGMLETLTRQLTGSASEAAKGSAKSIAQFWLDACQDRKVCARLQAEDLPIALYNLMKEKDAKEAKRIVKDFEEDLFQLVVQIILKVSAGHEESEKKLSVAVIEDIQHLAEIRDKTFINKVLLPLIKNEVTLPVSLHEIAKPIAEAEPSESWQPNFDALSKISADSTAKQVDYTAGFLPSSLLDPELKATVLKGFKEVIGKHSKNQLQ